MTGPDPNRCSHCGYVQPVASMVTDHVRKEHTV